MNIIILFIDIRFASVAKGHKIPLYILGWLTVHTS